MTDNSETPRIQRVVQSEDRFLGSELFESKGRALPARNGTGVYREPGRDIPVYHRCDVLVVGGGPSGCAAPSAASFSRRNSPRPDWRRCGNAMAGFTTRSAIA